MPALVNSKPGESGRREAEGTIVWPCEAKKSRKDWRISAEVMKIGNDEQKARSKGGKAFSQSEQEAFGYTREEPI